MAGFARSKSGFAGADQIQISTQQIARFSFSPVRAAPAGLASADARNIRKPSASA